MLLGIRSKIFMLAAGPTAVNQLIYLAMAAIVLSLGANEGQRERNLGEALRRLRQKGIDPLRVSGIYETEPVGAAADSRWFLNMAVLASTDLEPAETLAACLQVESDMGRRRDTRSPKGEPRAIDIDLLAWNDAVIVGAELTLPHPRMHARRFVLEPLAEIAPGWMHPIEKRTASEMLATLEDPALVRRVRDRIEEVVEWKLGGR